MKEDREKILEDAITRLKERLDVTHKTLELCRAVVVKQNTRLRNYEVAESWREHNNGSSEDAIFRMYD